MRNVNIALSSFSIIIIIIISIFPIRLKMFRIGVFLNIVFKSLLISLCHKDLPLA